MSTAAGRLRFSVIVCSRARPALLLRTLRAIRQLDHPNFEVLVVGDAEGCAAVRRAGMENVRLIVFEEPNLSAARNVGVGAAAGDVCAFIDDDAVPEPLWLAHHEAALIESRAAASVGFVRGPDGIGFQSRLESVDCSAQSHEEASGEKAHVPDLVEGRAVKLTGTNMTIRRDVLAGLGGFDPSYRYFLEDADMSLRLAQEGHRAAVAPLAEVHHALAPSARRTRRRAMRSLFDIGRSTAIFLRRHPGADQSDIRGRMQSRERIRALRAMNRGDIEPRDVDALLATLQDGWREGRSVTLPDLPKLDLTEREFLPVAAIESGTRVLTSRLAGRRRTVKAAAKLAATEAARVSVFSFSFTWLPHFVLYTGDGVWVHTGGQFLLHTASERRIRWCSFARSVAEEIARVAKRRGLNDADTGLSAGSE